jgi:hypothetical protein
MPGKQAGARYIKTLLKNPPPQVEAVSLDEVWEIKEDGSRLRRICGRWREDLPTFCPLGPEDNLHGVINPSREYVCTEEAGFSTLHPGIGCCARHQPREAKLTVDKSGEKGEDNFKILQALGDFDSYLDLAKARVTPDELLDIARPLYELEALKMMIIDYMQEFGYSEKGIESFANKIKDGAGVQLALAKRDHEIMKNKAIATIIKMMVVGFLDIIRAEIDDPRKAKEIATRLNDEILIPAQNSGLTEILQRQESSGAIERAKDLASSPEINPL